MTCSAPLTDAARAVQGSPSMEARSTRHHVAERLVRAEDSSRRGGAGWTTPSTAASKTSRRCSSDWQILSFDSRTCSSARSASDSARSLSSSACRASAWACVLRIWFRQDARCDAQPQHRDDGRRLHRGRSRAPRPDWRRWRAPRTRRPLTRSSVSGTPGSTTARSGSLSARRGSTIVAAASTVPRSPWRKRVTTPGTRRGTHLASIPNRRRGWPLPRP